MGDSLPLGDILPTLTLRVQRGRTLVSSWIFLPQATYLGHRPPTDRQDRLFPFPRVTGLLDFLVHDAKPSLLLHELFWSPIITLERCSLTRGPLTEGGKASCAGLASSVGVVFELRKHKGFELTVFLEAPKRFSTLSKTEPGVMQSPNRGLQHLRMN